MDKAVTPVMFRAWHSGEVLALFPTLPADYIGFKCLSYLHVGQHGSADYAHCIRTTRPAKPAEYADLHAELTKIGYNLKVYKREHKWMRAERMMTAEKYR